MDGHMGSAAPDAFPAFDSAVVLCLESLHLAAKEGGARVEDGRVVAREAHAGLQHETAELWITEWGCKNSNSVTNAYGAHHTVTHPDLC